MRVRSLLFVPGDRPDRMQKALGTGADALILDLEDSVAPVAKSQAREAVAAFLSRAERPVPLLVRVNPQQGALTEDDLAAVLPGKPDGIVLPKAESADDVSRLARRTRLPILPIATETPAAIFGLGGYAEAAAHMIGLTWGAEDLAAAIGAIGAREADGRYTAPFETVRSLALFGAHAAGVAAIDTVFPAIRDAEGLAAYAERGARDGFAGMLALHPDQVPIINRAYTPDAQSVAAARAIVAAFAAEPGAGVLVVDGRMVDAPHLAQARKILARAGETA